MNTAESSFTGCIHDPLGQRPGEVCDCASLTMERACAAVFSGHCEHGKSYREFCLECGRADLGKHDLCSHGFSENTKCPICNVRAEQADMVNHPPHYTSHPSGIEQIQITEHMNFCLGNVIKYVWRAGQKGNALEDLKKARFYLDREIERVTEQE